MQRRRGEKRSAATVVGCAKFTTATRIIDIIAHARVRGGFVQSLLLEAEHGHHLRD